MKSFKFCYTLKGTKTLVPTYITGSGVDVEDAYKDAFEKLCTRYTRQREIYISVNGGECINLIKASVHEVNSYHA